MLPDFCELFHFTPTTFWRLTGREYRVLQQRINTRAEEAERMRRETERMRR